MSAAAAPHHLVTPLGGSHRDAGRLWVPAPRPRRSLHRRRLTAAPVCHGAKAAATKRVSNGSNQKQIAPPAKSDGARGSQAWRQVHLHHGCAPPVPRCLDGVESSIHKGTLHGSIGTVTVTNSGHLSAGPPQRPRPRRRRRRERVVPQRRRAWTPLASTGAAPRAWTGPRRCLCPGAAPRRWSAPRRREGLPRAVQSGRCGFAAAVWSAPRGAGALRWRALAEASAAGGNTDGDKARGKIVKI
jgi:hypothetical protein